tara:strand:- start:384 stop:1535 length:1152 start_codon:yes stop_codon:yes gene_type:complete
MDNYGSFSSISCYFKQPIDIDYYWKFLIIIGSYYILPSLQFVLYQSKDLNNSTCYYNNKCKHDFYFIPAFNNIISNIFYVLFGIIFIITVRLTTKNKIDSVDIPINNNPALYYSLGVSLIFEGFCSAIFHICPSLLNFQFDTTFMFLGAILTFITLYQKRHMAPSPMRIYSFSALLIFINTLPLSGLSNGFEIWFWGGIFLLMAYLMIFGSIYLYYDQEYDINTISFKRLLIKIKNIKPKDIPKLILIISLNSITLGLYIFATITKPNFTDWLLGVCIINLVIYFLYYFIQKIKNKEPINKLIYIWLILDIIILNLSLVFFFIELTDKFLPMNESDALNKPCVLFNYFDYHDIWHILSAIGLFIFMNIIYFLDTHTNENMIIF